MDLDIIIVNHNHENYLKKNLSSLFSSTNKKFNVIVVDNTPCQTTADFIKNKYPKVNIIQNKKRQGFARNCNLGIKRSKNKFILISNADIEFTPKSIDRLYLFMIKNPNVGIAGPQLRFPNGKLQFSCRRFPNLKTFIVRRTPLRIFLSNSKENKYHLGYDLDHSKTQPVDWLLGACFMIRREMIDQIGMFDENYFLYVEDIDLCYRAWKKGWEVWYVPESVMIHHYFALSDKKFFSLYNLYHFKSMWYYFWKNIVFEKLK